MFEPIEIIREVEEVDRIVHMIAESRYATPIGYLLKGLGRPPVYALDGKDYIVWASAIEVWDHFELMAAERAGDVLMVRY